MKAHSSFISAIQHLARVRDFLDDFIRDAPAGAELVRQVKQTAKAISTQYNVLVTNPHMPQPYRDGLRKEWNSDVFLTPAIEEKLNLITPEQRELIETILDGMLRGEVVEFVGNE